MSAGIANALAMAATRRRIAASFPHGSEGRAVFVARARHILWAARDWRRALASGRFGGAA